MIRNITKFIFLHGICTDPLRHRLLHAFTTNTRSPFYSKTRTILLSDFHNLFLYIKHQFQICNATLKPIFMQTKSEVYSPSASPSRNTLHRISPTSSHACNLSAYLLTLSKSILFTSSLCTYLTWHSYKNSVSIFCIQILSEYLFTMFVTSQNY